MAEIDVGSSDAPVSDVSAKSSSDAARLGEEPDGEGGWEVDLGRLRLRVGLMDILP